MDPKKIRKILVVVLDNLGDTIMATSVCRPLRTLFPQALIGFWVKSYVAGSLEGHSLIDRLHASDPFWDSSPGHPKGSWAEFKSVLNQIKKENYDAALILNTEWRRSAACWWIRIPERVGFKRRKSAVFLTKGFEKPVDGQHFIDDHR